MSRVVTLVRLLAVEAVSRAETRVWLVFRGQLYARRLQNFLLSAFNERLLAS